MITTFSAIRPVLAKALRCAIIGAAIVALGGCSAVRLGYNNGPQLVWWWLDGYVDVSREQTPQVRQAIDRFFEWHRATQLTDYAALLASAQGAVLEPSTPALACRWQAQVRERLNPALERAIDAAADLVPGLGEAQFKHLQQRYAKNADEIRSDYLQADPAERLEKSVERVVERAEQLYGSLDEAQKRVIAAGVAASPFDPQAWLVERQRRGRDTLQTVRKLVADKADRDQRLAALRALAQRSELSPEPAYRAYQQKLGDYNCAFAAQLHNATTTAQRQRARERLRGWEEDLRVLAAQPPA